MIDPTIVEEIWSQSQINPGYATALREFSRSADETNLSEKKLSALPSLFCEAYGGSAQQAAPIVTIWNILRHAARLLDDVEDGHFNPSDRVAINLNLSSGLIFTAAHLLSELESHGVPVEPAQEIRRLFYLTLLQVCGGQHQDLTIAASTLEESWQIAGDKTAASLGLICWAGGRIVCSDKRELELCRLFGYNLGLLDQIRDDLTDLSAEEDLYKPARHSLPLAYTLAVLPPPEQETLLALLDITGQERANQGSANENLARQLIMKSGAAVYLTVQAALYREQTEEALRQMAVSLETKQQLQQLIDQLALR
jgi:geranylgeranyl pyrophosphate synthase